MWELVSLADRPYNGLPKVNFWINPIFLSHCLSFFQYIYIYLYVYLSFSSWTNFDYNRGLFYDLKLFDNIRSSLFTLFNFSSANKEEKREKKKKKSCLIGFKYTACWEHVPTIAICKQTVNWHTWDICLSVYLAVCLSVYLNNYLSVFLSICLSGYLKLSI